MPAFLPETLNAPFFTLEYRDGVFERLLPPDTQDLGGGLFRQGAKLWKLPGATGQDEPGEPAPADHSAMAALAEKIIKGRPLLSLLNRGPNPLIAQGPRLARDEERLMELSLVGAADRDSPGAGPLVIEARCFHNGDEWLPLTGLPRHRLFQNIIYEIIDGETLRELGESRGRFTLRGEDIPRFADVHSRLVFQFGDKRLKELFADDSVFIRRDALSLALGASRENRRPGGVEAWAAPVLRWGERRFPAEDVSLRMDREYILLEKQWARRKDIAAAGIFPLRSYAGGKPMEKIKLKAGELIRRGGGRFAGLFSGLEADTSQWLERGGKEEIFYAHLEFLRGWGLSGGVAIHGHREQAAFLASWLKRLARSGESRALLVMEKRYYDLYLPQALPELKTMPAALPGKPAAGAMLRIAFYEDLPLSPLDQRRAADILVLLEPEEAVAREQTYTHLRNISAALTLGIFSSAWELFHGPLAPKARLLFGIPEAELAPFLIRDTSRSLKLPQFSFPPPHIARPFAIPGQGLFNYKIEEKFEGLSGPDLYTELTLRGARGGPAPFVPLRLLKGNLDIDRMDADEQAFFVYWRGEFHRGNILKTGEGYIIIYARELCIFSKVGDQALNNFMELLRLWESYRDIFESLNDFLPRWLVDFAVLYGIEEAAFPLLLPHARECGDPLLADIYLHRRFIDANAAIEWGDIALLLAVPPPEKNLARDFETVINAVDRYLREEFHFKLFEFFYPPVYDTEKREAFAGMERSGRSVYRIEGLRFTKHPPLLAFLESLFRYTGYCFNERNGRALKGKVPFLGEPWKQIAASALGLAHNAPVPRKACSSFSLPPESTRSITLYETRLEKLRSDSDAVRDMLKIEDTGEDTNRPRPNDRSGKKSAVPALPVYHIPPSPSEKKAPDFSMQQFIEGLKKPEREALRIIAGLSGSPGGLSLELQNLAKQYRAMPEIIIDAINAAFLEQSGDLLLETVDEMPAIQQEYSTAVQKLLEET